MDNLLDEIIADQEKNRAVAGGDPPNPPADPPEGDPPPPPPPNPPAGDPLPPKGELLPHEIFGDEFKDKKWEDVKTVISRVPDLEKEVETLKGKQPEYANQTIAQYDNWVKNGGVDDFGVFNMVKNIKEDIDDVDALVAKEILENPEYAKFQSQVKQRIIEKYNIEATEENGLTEEQVLFNKASLSKDAKSAKTFITQQLEKMQVPQSPAKPNNEEVIAKRKVDWTAATEQSLSKITKVGIPYVKKDGDKETIETLMEYQIPENIRKQAQEQFVEIFSRVGDATPENIKQLENEFKADFILKNLPYIVSAAVSKKEAELTEAYDKKYAGMVVKDPGGSPPGTTTVSKGDEHIDGLLK
jgi:hypothetical protein